MKTRHGFTLMEVLLAVAIVTVLVAILLPTAGSFRDRANTVTCTSNLKALWSAQRSYQSDHADNFITYTDADGWAWTAKLMDQGYLSKQTKALFCPAFSKATDLETPEKVASRSGGNGDANRRGTYSHYGYNIYHVGGSTRYGGKEYAYVPARGSQITQPSRTILFIDNIYTPGADKPRGSFMVMDREDTSHVPDPRHQGRFQIIFVDGHVEAMQPADPAQIYAPYPAGLGRTTDNGSLWKR